MSESESLIGQKNNMRCIGRGSTALVFYLATVMFCLYMGYDNERKWQEIGEILNNFSRLGADQLELIDEMRHINLQMLKHTISTNKSIPLIIAITPTFARPVQKAELTRLSQTLLHVKNLFWIVIEDSPIRTQLVSNLLSESGIAYKHLNVVTPLNFQLKTTDPHWKKPRGIAQRNIALEWIRKNFNSSTEAVVYFADDDNTYSLKLFSEMIKTKVVGVWPVGLVGGQMVERPLCDNATNKVIGFNAAWKPDRKFPIDMAGFALNLRLVLEKKDARFSYEALSGYHETTLLEQMITKDQLEPLADCCTKVYVWHTRTESPQLKGELKLNKKKLKSNNNIEV